MKTIAHITDMHFDEKFLVENKVHTRENWESILYDIKSNNIKDIVIGGDIGQPDSYRWFFLTLKDFKIKITPGNHDKYEEINNYYKTRNKTIDNSLTDTFEDEYIKYILLDSSSYKINKIQYAWLKEQLRTTKKIILFVHHPILSNKTAIDKMYPLRKRKILRKLLQNRENQIFIFCGHYHMNDKKISKNITQYISPACSYQIEKSKNKITPDYNNYGYRLITIDGDLIETKVRMRNNGKFISL